MRVIRRLVLCVLFSAFCFDISLAQTQTPPGTDESRSLGDIARQYRKQKQSNVIGPPQNQIAARVLPLALDEQETYRAEITELLGRGDFDRLEKTAASLRSSKSRFHGGVWKLYAFYEGLQGPATGRNASEADWNAHLETLKQWAKLKPESVTARVALADAYLSWGYKARGGDYADKVTAEGWRLLGERTQLASLALKEAASLKAKCPHWYFVLLEIARTQGWEKAHVRALFEKAIAFEPDYYHYYREYANFLLPKWAGDEGEGEAFAEEVSKRVGGKQGAFLYFEIATVLNCTCGQRGGHLETMSWPKIKEGFAALEELYGMSNRKLNRFAYLAVLARDRGSAYDAFARIGDNWDLGTWRTEEKFEQFKMFAQRPGTASAQPANGTN